MFSYTALDEILHEKWLSHRMAVSNNTDISYHIKIIISNIKTLDFFLESKWILCKESYVRS